MNTAIRSSNKIARGWGSFKTSKKEGETKQKQEETGLQSKIARDPGPGQGDLISVSLLCIGIMWGLAPRTLRASELSSLRRLGGMLSSDFDGN